MDEQYTNKWKSELKDTQVLILFKYLSKKKLIYYTYNQQVFINKNI